MSKEQGERWRLRGLSHLLLGRRDCAEVNFYGRNVLGFFKNFSFYFFSFTFFIKV